MLYRCGPRSSRRDDERACREALLIEEAIVSPQSRPLALGLLAGSLCLAAVACSDPASMPLTAPDDTPVELELSRPEYMSRIKALGFRTDRIEDRGTYFIVEGDIALEKSYLAALPTDLPKDWFRVNPSQWRRSIPSTTRSITTSTSVSWRATRRGQARRHKPSRSGTNSPAHVCACSRVRVQLRVAHGGVLLQ